MKKLLLVICLASLLLVGCDNYSQPKPTTTSTMKAHMSQQRFMLIPVDGTLSIMVDKKTRVQYLLISEPYLGFMSPFIDQDGKPILFEGELDGAIKRTKMCLKFRHVFFKYKFIIKKS